MTTEKKSVPRLVEIQHARGEETEFYPTTQEIVDSVARWISRNGEITTSILDIGCGNGGFFDKLDSTDFFKSDNYGTKNYDSKLSKNFKKYA